ncbi:hypothetical protein M569_08664 [Genlisea aurea]|uniref:Uncharacterized protein n=1 Tax=Genlisea aurea TaxID=192259 RepID=S8CGY2_9LAMI|nr:hypothetical protein M569_08664 [Genlisea aurea]
MEVVTQRLSIGFVINSRRLLKPPVANRRLVKPSAAVNGGATTRKWADRLLADFQFLPSTSDSGDVSMFSPPRPLPSLPERYVSMPLDFYRVLGAESHVLGDGIRRAYNARVSKPPQYGFSDDALVSRRQILQAACETLANPSSRREYNQGLADDEFGTVLTQMPWEKVPGALCVLQEAGESDLVIKIGDGLLNEQLPKFFKQDIILSMALSYVDLSRDAMALSPPDFIRGCEMLEMALKLLQEESARSLAPDLQAQIDETLEEITPRCVLELLALPLGEEHKSKRGEGLQGVRNVLWAVGSGGATAPVGRFTREDFMNEAFLWMTAAEQVDLFVATPSNIPAESFEVYGVALALVSQAFMNKKPYLVQDADNLFQQLQQTKAVTLENSTSTYGVPENREVNFALERGLCSLLIGEVDGCLMWLGLDDDKSPYRVAPIANFVLEHSKDDSEDYLLPGMCRLLEAWLMEVVFPRFRETRDVKFKLGDYYDDPTVLRYLERLEGVGRSPLAVAAAIVKIGQEATAALDIVKAGAIQALHKVFIPRGNGKKISEHSEENENSNYDLAVPYEDAEIYRSLDDSSVDGTLEMNHSDWIQQQEVITDKIKSATIKIMSAGVAVGLLTLVGLKFLPYRSGSYLFKDKGEAVGSSDVINGESLLAQSSDEVPRMDARFADILVHKWHNIKAQALGPDHCLAVLPEVLDGQMLKIWTEKASEMARNGWFWEYELLNLSIDSVSVSVDGRRATVEATFEESAKLTDVAHPENNNSLSSSYTTRYEMSFTNDGWKIVEGAALKS